MVNIFSMSFLFSLTFVMQGCVTLDNGQYIKLVSAKVKQRAAFDLACTQKELKVVSVGQDSYGATGCGKRATYVISKEVCKKQNFLRNRYFVKSKAKELFDEDCDVLVDGKAQ